MGKQALKEKILKAVGLDKEHSEKVFEHFLEMVSDILEVTQTLKIEGIGYFQLQIEPVSRLERDSAVKGKKILIYKSDDVEDSTIDARPFLTLEIESDIPDRAEFNESVFNLSINKSSTIFDDSEKETGKQIDDEIDNLIQDRTTQFIARGIILDGYELLNNESVQKVDDFVGEEINSNILEEVSKHESNEILTETDESSNKIEAEEIEEQPEEAEEEQLAELETENQLNDFSTESEIDEEKIDEAEKENPFDELNALINNDKETAPEESVQHQDLYDNVKSSMSSERKGNKRTFIYGIVALFIIVAIAVIYYTSTSNTALKKPTFVEKKEKVTHEKPKPPVKVDSVVSEEIIPIDETSVNEPLLKQQGIKTKEPKLKTNYSGLYRDIAKDVSITDRIYFDGKKFMVQISSWKSKTIAEHEVAKLKKKGFDAFIYRVYIKSKDGTYNRVRVGYFESKKEAEQFLKVNKL